MRSLRLLPAGWTGAVVAEAFVALGYGASGSSPAPATKTAVEPSAFLSVGITD